MFQMNLIKKLKTSYRIRLSGDNKFLCHNMDSKTIVYDLTTWEKIIELNKPNYPSDMRFSENNKYLLIKSTTGTIYVYNTASFQLVKKIQSKKSFKLVEGDTNFTQDNLMLLSVLETNDGQQIGTINIHSGEYTILTEFENAITLIYYNQFLKNRNYHLFTLSYVNNETGYRENKIVKVKEPINKQSIELKSHPEILIWDSVIFDSIHDVYILVNGYEIILVDSDFKKILKRGHIIDNDSPMEHIGYFRYLHQSNDGRFIVVTYNESVIILRYEDLKTILIEKIPYACFAEFSNDDQYLLVGTWENGYVLENNLPEYF
ncbi:hypothetical protein B0I26_105178 [Anoxybacillus vitaminiphilus]|uniref:WD40 repeat protein n=1 Tax=Paranoxybacillus vitaminiphilus TaxID=581036 RepID=A0A327YJQ6_9BACL|nr:hypothetical protein [Anoxybacillus vitaminiphilus]RAK19995.1 hypothetical protein B0I26_105178 [Anoxybacillus vitaminiphilus]